MCRQQPNSLDTDKGHWKANGRLDKDALTSEFNSNMVVTNHIGPLMRRAHIRHRAPVRSRDFAAPQAQAPPCHDGPLEFDQRPFAYQSHGRDCSIFPILGNMVLELGNRSPSHTARDRERARALVGQDGTEGTVGSNVACTAAC